ncbi:hypothetical protein NC652_037636 [Populus alba x Populus x berolinensis]|nr:hypothetical protein NC652_037636 [Populus alba x Populus x berolinensis]
MRDPMDGSKWTCADAKYCGNVGVYNILKARGAKAPCVCKLWRSSISDPKFVKSHLKRAKEVNSSCHRLLLSTRTPQSVDFEAASGGDEDTAVQELEYPEAIRKVPDIGNATTSVEAYQGIFCNGAALWLGMQEIASKKVYVIVAFDISDGEFKEVVPLLDHFDTVVLGMSGNCLCTSGECNGSYFEARTHDQEHDSKASRTKYSDFGGVFSTIVNLHVPKLAAKD